MFPLLTTLAVLKSTPRRGWVIRGVPEPESVADHMYQMAMICLAYPWSNESDRAKAVEMAIVHDAPEAITGDTIPSDGMSRDEKHLREKLGLDFLVCLAKEEDEALAGRLESLWMEYEERTSVVSKFVHQVDKFEALHQAFIYAKRYPHVNLRDFRSHRQEITDPWLVRRADEVLREWDALDSHAKSGMVVVFVVGGPGVGKGTQSALGAEEFGFEHISVGDLLRAEQNTPGSTFGRFIGDSIRNSVVVPATLTMTLLKKSLATAQEQGKRGIFLDGFPRSIEQLEAFKEEISLTYSTIAMDCPETTLVQRIMRRAATSGREDDNPDSIIRRVDTFQKSQERVLQLLSEEGRVERINCAGSVDEVRSLFRHSVQEIMRGEKSKGS